MTWPRRKSSKNLPGLLFAMTLISKNFVLRTRLPGAVTLACFRSNWLRPSDVPKKTVPMPRRLISTGSPFERQGGYSRAVVDGNFCFVAGTTGYDYATMAMPDGIAEQARNAFGTIAKALDEAGF